jgi:magnesium chelatase family protein
LPPLSKDEIIEVTKLHSLAGEAKEEIVQQRPFRSPHHSASHISLVGGGKNPKPGEISLAHRGVLFLDELPEYSRPSLESLRQPLEDKQISISRVNERTVFPADFMLIATQNPCPCGYASDPEQDCSCSAHEIVRYQKKVSGPLLDRIDLVVTVSRVEPRKLLDSDDTQQKQTDARAQVQTARRAQHERFNSSRVNATLTNREVTTKAKLSKEAKALLDTAANTLKLSARAYFKVIKVARTIADIEKSDTVLAPHISEALQYRPRPHIGS